MKCAVLYFVKNPEPGKVKTRLARTIGDREAARIYKNLAQTNFNRLQCRNRKWTVIVLFDPPGAEMLIRQWLPGDGCLYHPQINGSLGERLVCGFEYAFKYFDCVIAAGSDTLSLEPSHFERAFEVLKKHDVVLGPARDGGYYLIGLKENRPGLFENIPWSSPDVMRETLKRIHDQNLSCDRIDPLDDLDHENQLEFLKGDRMKISVVIPTYNEESTIEQTLCSLHPQHPDEVIVVDGGSTDATVSLARKNNSCIVLQSKKGRALQMNAGAQRAAGDIFVFLHADTQLPLRGLELIRNAISQGHQAGRFYMRFDQSGMMLKFFETYTRFHFFSYGDQVFFMTRNIYENLGGYNEKAPFEDVEFYRRLLKLTHPVILKSKVTTSARRFIKTGSLRQKWINFFLMFLYYLGFDVLPHKKKLYPDVR